MAILDHEGEIPEEYLTGFEREMQETTDGKVTKSWTEYAKGYVPRDTKEEDVSFDKLKHKSSWFADKDSLGKQTVSGTWQTQSRGLGAARAQQDKQSSLKQACLRGDANACAIIQASAPGYIEGQQQAAEKVKQMSRTERRGFAEGGLMDSSSRLWKMESSYPEFQKGIASKVTKDRVPTQQIEEEYMYSPTHSGYPQGYAEGGSVYDTEGSMLAPEVPLNFDEDMAMEAPMEEDTSELGLSPEETEVLSQAMSDYPELEVILNKIDAASTDEFMGDGTVEGPGTGTSDSINAKLSDGEFVFTAKAVKQLGVDKLRKMMSKAEDDYDESSMKQEYQQMGDVGFASGGFFNRPGYKDGDLVTKVERPQSTKKELTGSKIKRVTQGTEERGRYAAQNEAHMDEMAARERNAYIDSYEGPDANYDDDMSQGDRALLERGNEAIYPKEEYPHLYRSKEEQDMIDGKIAIVTPRKK